MTNERKEVFRSYLKKAAGIAGMFLSPFVSYILFEYVTGNLQRIPLETALLNVGWIALFYVLVFAVCGCTRWTITISAAVLYLISVAEAFVFSFRGKPILLTEVMALGTALSVAENYAFKITGEMIMAAVGVLVWCLIFWMVPVSIRSWKLRIVNAVLCVALVFGGAKGFYQTTIIDKNVHVNQWDMNTTYAENGFLFSTVLSVRYMVKNMPEEYSEATLNQMYDQLVERMAIREAAEADDPIVPTNIICIMNESLSELAVAGEFETNIPYFPYISSLKENTVRGSLFVPVFGSLTSNTEFEFLTGDPMALLPANTIAYQYYVKPDTLSLVSTVKQQGYCAVAMHPYPGGNWNRIECYENMGFDEFLDEKHYAGSQELRNYVSDQADFEKIIELVEQKEFASDKLFVFNVTMQNHGGYDMTFDNFEQEVWLTGEHYGKYPKADQYFSLMKRSDDAFRALTEYFEQQKEPTMIVMFGDHQPGIEDAFYDELLGYASQDADPQTRMDWYQTPFLIWTNYEQESRDMGPLSTSYLGSVMLDLANLKTTPYDEFLLGMAEELPVVHFLGCIDGNDRYYRWDNVYDTTNSFRSSIKAYEMLVYNHSLDNHELKKLYSLVD